MTEARYLSPADLASYLSISRGMIEPLVKAGRLPEPVYLTPRLPRWDREAVDAALGKNLKSADRTLGDIDAWFDRDGKTSAQGRVGKDL